MVGLALGLGGCANTAITVLNAVIPNDGYTLTADIPYGADPRQHLDVYSPKQGAGPRPVVLFFYGGSWKSGAKKQYRFLGEALTSKGYVAVIADYRVYPAVKFPAFEDDAARALKWVQNHAAEYGGDTAKLFVMGHSAGANIAALAVLDPTYAKAAGATGRVRGFIGLAGPYAFRPEQTESVRDVFLGTGDLERARPITFVAAQHPPPPMFLAHGRDDTTVYPQNTEQMTAAARAAGGTVRDVFYDKIGHVGLMAAFAKPFRGRAPVLNDVSAFIDATVKAPAP